MRMIMDPNNLIFFSFSSYIFLKETFFIQIVTLILNAFIYVYDISIIQECLIKVEIKLFFKLNKNALSHDTVNNSRLQKKKCNSESQRNSNIKSFSSDGIFTLKIFNVCERNKYNSEITFTATEILHLPKVSFLKIHGHSVL